MNLTWCPLIGEPITWALRTNPRPCVVVRDRLTWLDPHEVDEALLSSPTMHAAILVLEGEDMLSPLHQLFLQGRCYAWNKDAYQRLDLRNIWWAHEAVLMARPILPYELMPTIEGQP